jgi:hypothetical protein
LLPLTDAAWIEPPGGRKDIHSSKSNWVSSLSTGVLVPEATAVCSQLELNRWAQALLNEHNTEQEHTKMSDNRGHTQYPEEYCKTTFRLLYVCGLMSNLSKPIWRYSLPCKPVLTCWNRTSGGDPRLLPHHERRLVAAFLWEVRNVRSQQ